eukprot:UN11888
MTRCPPHLTLAQKAQRRQINRAQKRRGLNTRRIRRKGTNHRTRGRQLYDKRRKRKNRR